MHNDILNRSSCIFNGIWPSPARSRANGFRKLFFGYGSPPLSLKLWAALPMLLDYSNSAG